MSRKCESPFCRSLLPDPAKGRRTCSGFCRTDLSILRRLAKKFGVDAEFLVRAVEEAKGNGAAHRKRGKLEDDERVCDFMKKQFEHAFGAESLRPGQVIYRIAKGSRLCRMSEATRWLRRFVGDGFVVTAEDALLRWRADPNKGDTSGKAGAEIVR